jgi:polyhydroxybutyrate depolymerase
MPRRSAARLGLMLVLAGCSRASSNEASESHAARPLPAPTSVTLDTGELHAELRLPRLAPGKPAPLLVMLHGLGSSGAELEASGWLDFAARSGIAWLAPSGPFDRQGRRFWDAGPSCCNFDQLAVDHVAALSTLLERALDAANIDPERVIVGGHSNGAFMAHRLACERPDRVSGVIAIAGAGPLDPSACKPPRRLRVLQIHGDADPIVPYLGGHVFQRPSLPELLSAPKTVSNWAALLGCGPTPVPLAPIDLEPALAGPETQVLRYTSCKAGQLELWTVSGGAHNVGFGPSTPAAVWEFMSR